MKNLSNNQTPLKIKFLTGQEGYVVSIIVFFILIIMLSIAISMSSLIAYRQKISTNSVKSTQSYYTAESGAEDALLRLSNNPNMSPLSYSLSVSGTTTNIVIPSIIGGARAITSDGNTNNINRKLQVVYSIDTQGVGFYYGAQVGDGGLTMNNGSRIVGNVFSNGNISGGAGTVTKDVIVAGNGHSIKDITVEGDALSYSCLSPAVIVGVLTHVTGGTVTCTYGSISTQSNEISSQPLPISQAQIDGWKSDAAAGGIVTGNYTIANNETQSLGPVKITGSLVVSNGATLIVTGTIHVVGNIVFDNGSTIKLHSSYGTLSGIILSDGNIEVKNNSTLLGSGQSGSYLLLLSTSSSDTAILIDNNATGAIFYTSAGGIELKNNISAIEVTGYKVKLDNNAVVQYESGIANLLFTSGPSAGWKVTSWEEK